MGKLRKNQAEGARPKVELRLGYRNRGELPTKVDGRK